MKNIDNLDNIDKILYQCMPGLEEKLLDAMPQDEKITYHFSDKFERKMKKLCKQVKLKEQYGFPIATMKKSAAAIILILGVTFAMSLSVKAVREKLFDYFVEIYETYIEKTYQIDEENVEEFKPLFLKKSPKGYELTVKDVGESYVIWEYQNKELESEVIFSQNQIRNGTIVANDTEYEREKTCVIRGNKGKIQYKGNMMYILWLEDGCDNLMLGKNVSEKELLQMCESLEE